MNTFDFSPHTRGHLKALTCFESRLEWLALWRCLLEVHVIDGAGVHGRGALSGRLRPRPSVRDKRAYCHSGRGIQSLAQPRREKRCMWLVGGTWRHRDSLLDLLGGGACGGEHAGPSRSWRVRERARRRYIPAPIQGAGRVCGDEVGAIGRGLWLGYGRGGHSHFGVEHLGRSIKLQITINGKKRNVSSEIWINLIKTLWQFISHQTCFL